MKNSDFWKSTLSNTLGTIIGIVLTFGTTLGLQRCEREKTERTMALMVIHNLEYYCETLEADIALLQMQDSLNSTVWDHWPDRYDQIPDDTLQLFINGLISRSFVANDNAVESIFSSNIDTWKSIGSSEFIELAGKCFSATHLITQIREEIDEWKQQNYKTLMQTTVYTDNPTNSLAETTARVFCSPELCSFIKIQHTTYVPTLQMGLSIIRECNEKNKQLMHVSDSDLEQFGFHNHKDYDITQPL